ncbi:hypothetical protein [Marinobacter salarius]|nr:hypothetical protein [Marinobacter salarius]MDM8181257.1 hypothetical protein [Marinobacter salarius]
MTKKRKLPQTGGQYQRDSKGNPVPRSKPKTAEPKKADQPTSVKE